MTTATTATRPAARVPRPTTGAAPRTIRVLHVINGEHYAGAERVQDLLAAELADHDVQTSFVCLKPGQFAEVRRSKHVPLHEIAMRGRFDLRAVWRLVTLIRRGEFDLLHSHSPRSGLVAALASKITGVPMVHHVHSPTTEDTTNRLRCRLNAWVERFAFAQAKTLVAVSESLGRRLNEQGYGVDKVAVVPNGVPGREAIARRGLVHLSTPSDTLTIGTVALYRPRKGLEVLLRSIAKLRALGHAVRLRAVGAFETSEYEHQIRSLAHELGLDDAVDWIGFTTDVDAELARMDLFVLPSLFGEGMPMVVLEAMAAGLPVVATRVEGIPEVVRDGIDGRIAEPGDVDSLSAAIGQVAADDLTRLGQNARRRHAERFSSEAMAAAVAAVYRKVVA